MTDKKDGIFYLTLRDYSGDAQTIGQFASKNDAHQALYLILQALLEQPTGIMYVEQKPNLFWRVLKTILKYLAILVIAAIGLYYFLRFSVIYATSTQTPAAVSAPATEKGVSSLPQGEAVDADDLLNNMAAPSEPTPEALPEAAQAPTK